MSLIPLSATSRPTRASIALPSLTPENFSLLQSNASRYSDSTLKKHLWVKPMYENFCLNFNLTPWPLQSVPAATFVRWLGLNVGYAIGSIEDVIIPSMKRIHEEICLEKLAEDVSAFIAQALREIKRSKNLVNSPNEREPALISDVDLIIKNTPDGLPTKSDEASLWLLAVSTGARAITCSNVTLGDIHSIKYLPTRHLLIVQIKFRVTKGTPHWNHIISLEGNPFQKSNTNFIYWFINALFKTHQLDLVNFNDWNLTATQKSTLVWPWSRDSMRELFKSRAIAAGFPAKLFTFHSLRAGFICSALIKSGTNKEQVQAILENTAFVAGWVPGLNAQLRYVKTCAKKTIVASRLVVPRSTSDEPVNVIETELTTIEGFHNIRLNPPSWPADTNYKAFYKLVAEKFHKPGLTPDQLTNYKQFLWIKGYDAVIQNYGLEDEVKAMCIEKPNWKLSKNKSAIEFNVRRQVGRQFIANKLNENFESLSEYVTEFISNIQEEIDSNRYFQTPENRHQREKHQVADREKINGTNIRKRRVWTRQEDYILVSNFKSGQRWKNIAPLIEGRTHIDCKDRWRNLIKKFKTKASIFNEYEVNP